MPVAESLAASTLSRHAVLVAERTNDEKLRATVAEKVGQMLPA